MVMDAEDKQQRFRRIADVLDDVKWLQGVYPFDQEGVIYIHLGGAATSLQCALDEARREARDEALSVS